MAEREVSYITKERTGYSSDWVANGVTSLRQPFNVRINGHFKNKRREEKGELITMQLRTN